MFKKTVDNQLHNWMDHDYYEDRPLKCENCGDSGVWQSHYMEMVSGFDHNVCGVDCLMELIGAGD